ncbi:Methionine--tRNA ligase [Candidatus Tiddalikarchaeum anstoanum]|nr:Methionine--tRNA ligase [Candidatus Tiddalikarchaeum anstoanum]
MKPKFYVTTPIYYVTDKPHIGSAYPTIAADILARYNKINGSDVFFLTGSDEHGEKLQIAAEKNNVEPQKFVDEISQKFKVAWKKLNIEYNRFIRTSDPDHIKKCQEFYKKVYDKGDIYKGTYEGLHCIPCEAYWTKIQAPNNICPDCKRELKLMKEESYFFKLGKYQDKIIEHIKKNPNFIQPETRRNEILSFLKQPLQDLSISRTNIKWGIPVPNDPKHVLYVWFDALINYLTAVDNDKLKAFWPPNLHIVGKEITRFHCITWPGMLLAAGYELPKTIFGHGWWTANGEKMSKSKGNVFDPIEMADKYGVDAFRYFLFRQMPFGSDGDFSEAALVERLNNELGSEIGNLVTRTMKMLQLFANSCVPKSKPDSSLLKSYKLILSEYKESMAKYDLFNALNKVMEFDHLMNKYITNNEPWSLAKKDKVKLEEVLFNISQAINALSCLLYPFMPDTSKKIDSAINIEKSYNEDFGNVKPGTKFNAPIILFQKVEKKVNHEIVDEKKKTGSVSFDDFKKIDIRTGVIKQVEKLTDKLYKLKVLADKERTIVSGIAEFYTDKELLNKKIVLITNLEPKQIKGVLSEGMVLAAEKDGKVVLLTTDKEVGENAEVL